MPDYLRMNFQLLDDKGRRIGSGRDLALLKQRYGDPDKSGYHALPAMDLERKDQKLGFRRAPGRNGGEPSGEIRVDRFPGAGSTG